MILPYLVALAVELIVPTSSKFWPQPLWSPIVVCYKGAKQRPSSRKTGRFSKKNINVDG